MDCNQFLNETFSTKRYPADKADAFPGMAPVDGKTMYETQFNFDTCKLGNNNILEAKRFYAIAGKAALALRSPREAAATAASQRAS